ncbi:class I SAM-dependent methyltransferase [Kineococcus radiotolerans]|uniref:Methyltransferase type 12 n=1 Tax=Kineococcus radiotolerans (strain ATCC BAA-149 / DSM 14245 / SRS30216) TaxID=266940 RepID=A6WBT9_KINRD|nr:class I SAM-dependent methyltransferase [Kineococcus radiotolerans]ABS04278.1 Methyltransferase type 12 [Kineococcus radiotolerans SRS30216 = ATCC BAA-149]
MTLPDLRTRDRTAVELMDDPDCDLPALERTYAQFRAVNAVVAGWQLAYRRHVRPLLREDRVTTILDVGCGGGDLARALARWARRDGRRAQVTGIDPDRRAHAWAARQPPVPGVDFRCAHSSDLVAEGLRFDVVVSNHVLHHLDEPDLRTLLEDSRALARARVAHSDIARGAWAYRLFSWGTRPLAAGSFIREDGLTSIRRSYTPAELAAAAGPGWRVERPWPARNLLLDDELPGDALPGDAPAGDGPR